MTNQIPMSEAVKIIALIIDDHPLPSKTRTMAQAGLSALIERWNATELPSEPQSPSTKHEPTMESVPEPQSP